MIRYKLLVLLFAISVSFGVESFGREYEVTSPDKNLQLKVDVEQKILYSLGYKSKQLIKPSPISLTLSGNRILGTNPEVLQVKRRSVDEQIIPPVRIKSNVIADKFNEMSIEFKGGFGLICRAYDDGAAYRFVTDIDGEIEVITEEATFNFTGNHAIYFPEEESFQTHSERQYKYLKLGTISDKMMCCVPALVEVKDGPKVLITEADLEDYPGLYLRGGSNDSLYGKYPAFALAEKARSDRDVPVTKRADFIAKTSGRRSFPWRVLIVAEKDGDLIESQMIYKLALQPALLTKHRPGFGQFLALYGRLDFGNVQIQHRGQAVHGEHRRRAVAVKPPNPPLLPVGQKLALIRHSNFPFTGEHPKSGCPPVGWRQPG
jgi:alpha-glucosidase